MNQKPAYFKTFGKALRHLKKGGRVTRYGWEEPGSWLELAKLGICVNGAVLYTPTQTDILAEDWVFVDQENEE